MGKKYKRYKTVILGCGPRAEIHAQAYEGLENLYLSAFCDRHPEKCRKFSEQFHVKNYYNDLEEMLTQEQPDVLQIVTKPTVRSQPMMLAAKHGVKGIIVEKPLALDLEEVDRIRTVASESEMKIAVNMQRRYFQTCQQLKKVLERGDIGEIQFIRCVTRGNILTMGTHVIDLLLYFLNDQTPVSVWSCTHGMNGYEYDHPAPADMNIRLVFPNGLTVYFEDADNAVGTWGEDIYWQHMEFNFWGTHGRAWWTQNRDWGYQSDKMSTPFIEKSIWEESDLPGQREFTKAMGRWLDSDDELHENRLETALLGFDIITTSILSAILNQPLDFPYDIDREILAGKINVMIDEAVENRNKWVEKFIGIPFPGNTSHERNTSCTSLSNDYILEEMKL